MPTGYVDANTPADERERIGRRLREGQIKVVCNVYCLTTGVDWDVRCIILARPTKSEILYTQIIGRGLRTAEGKSDCLILDHSDRRFGSASSPTSTTSTLDDGKHRKSSAQAQQKAPPLPKECPSCSYLKPAGVHKCPGCGFAPERQSSIEERDGELVQLNGKRKDKAEHHRPHAPGGLFDAAVGAARSRLQARLCRREVHGSLRQLAARSDRTSPMAPDAPFLNWLKSQQIAFHKRRQKEAQRAA